MTSDEHLDKSTSRCYMHPPCSSSTTASLPETKTWTVFVDTYAKRLVFTTACSHSDVAQALFAPAYHVAGHVRPCDALPGAMFHTNSSLESTKLRSTDQEGTETWIFKQTLHGIHWQLDQYFPYSLILLERQNYAIDFRCFVRQLARVLRRS